ncbi:MAG: deoxyguanosinetriphosphate triphosphohydrolase [Pirellulales bacterium]
MDTGVDTEPNAIFEREAVLLAPYAMHSADSAGRKHAEPPQSYRGPFQRDRDRILHSAAFRRLSHKTQVFTGEMGDYHRTRLTHTLEVASIARTLARALRLNEDLVEALALAHDVGHPPFGHSGEDVLDECLRDKIIRDGGGFNHNAQALRIVELLENRYPEFPGLNLSLEVLEGQTRRIDKSAAAAASPLLEVQVVDAADSIAYDSHDVDDSLELGLLALDQLLAVPLWREAAERVRQRFAKLDDRQLRRAIVHELIHWQVGDLLAVVEQELSTRGIASVADVRRAPVLVAPSAELADLKLGLERFLFKNVYRHQSVEATRNAARQALREMFEILVAAPDRLPAKFRARVPSDGAARAVADYLAGMTDRYALEEHRRLASAAG